MRRTVATALVSFAAGLAARAVLRRLADRRNPVPIAAPAPVASVPDRDAVVLAFPPRVVAVETRTSETRTSPAAPVRCGDNGGRTKAGAPCGSRATSGGRCHHHRVAA